MVIVSWNMAKSSGIPIERVLRYCERWGTSLLLVQEPTGSLLEFGSRRKDSQPRGCESSWRGHLFRGGSQGSIVIVSREGVTVSNLEGVDLGVGQGTRRVTATNPLVLFDAQEGGERLRIGTCHAPFDSSARSQYASSAVARSREKRAHCMIGDVNTYGTATPGRTRTRSGSGYQTPLLGATSNRGRGHPLDKAFVADSVGTSYRAGRIIPGPSRRDVLDSPGKCEQVADIVDPDWQACKSDHLPIYIAFHDQVDRVRDLFKKRDEDDEDPDDPPPRATKRFRGGGHGTDGGSRAITA